MSNAAHCNTASITSTDARGLTGRHIAYLRKTPEDALEPLITRQRHDVIGHLVEQRDPRLADALKPNLATVYGLAGQPVMVDSVDAGWRISLPGLAGEILQRWDARGSHWRTVYDEQLRPVAIDENDQPNVETFSYADASADKAFNLCGQLISQVDPSGTVEWLSFGLLGQALHDSRTITGAGTRNVQPSMSVARPPKPSTVSMCNALITRHKILFAEAKRVWRDTGKWARQTTNSWQGKHALRVVTMRRPERPATHCAPPSDIEIGSCCP